jgi:hypothetical protein
VEVINVADNQFCGIHVETKESTVLDVEPQLSKNGTCCFNAHFFLPIAGFDTLSLLLKLESSDDMTEMPKLASLVLSKEILLSVVNNLSVVRRFALHSAGFSQPMLMKIKMDLLGSTDESFADVGTTLEQRYQR